MLFRAVEHREFSKFCKFGARYLKNGRSHKNFCLYSKSSKSGQKYIRTIKITKKIYYATQNFAILVNLAVNAEIPPSALLTPKVSKRQNKYKKLLNIKGPRDCRRDTGL